MLAELSNLSEVATKFGFPPGEHICFPRSFATMGTALMAKTGSLLQGLHLVGLSALDNVARVAGSIKAHPRLTVGLITIFVSQVLTNSGCMDNATSTPIPKLDFTPIPTSTPVPATAAITPTPEDYSMTPTPVGEAVTGTAEADSLLPENTEAILEGVMGDLTLLADQADFINQLASEGKRVGVYTSKNGVQIDFQLRDVQAEAAGQVSRVQFMYNHNSGMLEVILDVDFDASDAVDMEKHPNEVAEIIAQGVALHEAIHVLQILESAGRLYPNLSFDSTEANYLYNLLGELATIFDYGAYLSYTEIETMPHLYELLYLIDAMKNIEREIGLYTGLGFLETLDRSKRYYFIGYPDSESVAKVIGSADKIWLFAWLNSQGFTEGTFDENIAQLRSYGHIGSIESLMQAMGRLQQYHGNNYPKVEDFSQSLQYLSPVERLLGGGGMRIIERALRVDENGTFSIQGG